MHIVLPLVNLSERKHNYRAFFSAITSVLRIAVAALTHSYSLYWWLTLSILLNYPYWLFYIDVIPPPGAVNLSVNGPIHK